MARSPIAAESTDDEVVAHRGGRLSRFFAVAAIAVCLGLSACARPAPAVVVATPIIVAQPAAAAEPTPVPPASLPAEPAAARIPALPVLTGLGAGELMALLGEPDFRRREPPAELWQYRTADCVLDVFLYGEGGRYRVVRSETRDRHLLPPLGANCTAVFDRRAQESRL
jgi:hypothetical protein